MKVGENFNYVHDDVENDNVENDILEEVREQQGPDVHDIPEPSAQNSPIKVPAETREPRRSGRVRKPVDRLDW